MGMIASTFADYIILTTDNARRESPKKINEQIQKGFASFQAYETILDRKKAIEHFSDKACVQQIVNQLEML